MFYRHPAAALFQIDDGQKDENRRKKARRPQCFRRVDTPGQQDEKRRHANPHRAPVGRMMRQAALKSGRIQPTIGRAVDEGSGKKANQAPESNGHSGQL